MELAIDIWHRRAKVDSDQTIEIAAEIEMLKGMQPLSVAPVQYVDALVDKE